MTTCTLLNALRAGTAALPLLLAGTALGRGFNFDAEDSVEESQDQQAWPQLELNAMRMGTLEQGDGVTANGHFVDGYDVELAAGQTYRLETSGQGFTALIFLSTTEGGEIDGLAFDPDDTGFTFTVAQAGTYRVGIMTLEPGQSGMYMVGFGEVDQAPTARAARGMATNNPGLAENERPADNAGAGGGQVVDINIPQDAQQIEATLDQDDLKTEDGKFFSFLSMDLTQGQTFHFLIESDGFPVMLNMQDNDGNAVMINGVGLDGRYINVTAPHDGNYSLLIVGLEPNRGGDYRVRAWQGEPAFAPGQESGPGQGTEDGGEGMQMFQAVMDRDDILLDDGRYFAFHPVELTAGTTYTIDVASNAFDVVGYLFDAGDNQLDTNDDAPQMGTNARMTFTPQTTGTYSVGVSSAKPGKTGGYQVTVTPQGTQHQGPRPGGDVEDTPVQEHNILLNASGQADAENMYYAGDFRLEAGQRVVIETYELSDGCDTVLQLRRSTDPEAVHDDDPVVAENDDYAGLLYSRIVFTAEEAGDYYIAVGVYEGSAGTFNVMVRDALPAPEPIIVEDVEIEKDSYVLLGDFEFQQGLNWIVFETYDLQNGVDTVIELCKTVDPERASDDDPVVATNDDFFTNDLSSRLYFQCEEAGLYYVRIRNIGKNTGTCTFAIVYEE